MRRALVAVMMVWASGAGAADVILPDGKKWEYDANAGRDIMRTCAACHGEFGEGGGGGVYPRISGMHPEYLADQLRAFKSRERENIPMIPYANDRELPERDVLDVAQYLSEITPPKHPPPDSVEMDAFERLKLARQAVQIPREPGDLSKGKEVYEKYECYTCHGRQGEGRVKKPPLSQQHMRYLHAQQDLFLSGKRKHEDVEELMRPLTAEDWRNVWAYVSTLDD